MASISIVMTVDNNYIYQVAVTIFSIYKNNTADTKVQITILCGEDFNEDNKEWLINTINKLKNIEVFFYTVSSYKFDAVEGVGHVSLCSYYRLLIPEIINVDKCIFLDTDLIVQSDIKELYDIELNNEYLAAALDIGFVIDPDFAVYHMNRANLRDLQGYFNAGVLVLNLKKMRKDKIVDVFMNEMSNKHFYMDQDVLNRTCKGKVKIISSKYNCFHRINLKRSNRFLGEDAPVIIHYSGPYKPWNNCRVRYANNWWNYAKEILSDEEYKNIKESAVLLTQKNDWCYIAKKALNEEEIIIVGYSLIGVRLHDSLRMLGVKGKIIFCDGSDEKHVATDEKIYYMEDIVSEKSSALWIISSQNYYREIYNNLINNGISEERIIRYFDKQQGYFEHIDESLLEMELSDKYKMMVGMLE